MSSMDCKMKQAPSLRVSGVVSDSIVDGPGLRLAVFTQGCPHHCPGCHNPGSHAPAGGYQVPLADIAAMAEKNPLLTGVTLTGGEPMEQAGACLALLSLLRDALTVWVYTGYTYEELMEGGTPEQIALAQAADVLVDGRFEMAQRSLELRFRGSRNQRLIDMKAARKEGKIVLWEPPVW